MIVIGITGLSCSGKTYLSEKLKESLGDECLSISMDNYYKEIKDPNLRIIGEEPTVNFDVPESVDLELLSDHLKSLKRCENVSMPKFDFETYLINESMEINPKSYKFVILEGVFIFCNEELRNQCDLKIWVETRDYICALRRCIKYTTQVKKYTPEFIYKQCLNFVIPGKKSLINRNQN